MHISESLTQAEEKPRGKKETFFSENSSYGLWPSTLLDTLDYLKTNYLKNKTKKPNKL